MFWSKSQKGGDCWNMILVLKKMFYNIVYNITFVLISDLCSNVGNDVSINIELNILYLTESKLVPIFLAFI